tara:strand:+ start:129 stop:581 length:453 start_codon:yes stop_codon:yes gene_type:complete
MNSNTAGKIAKWAAPVLVGLGFFGFRSKVWQNPQFSPFYSIEQELEDAVEQINKDTPVKIDAETTLLKAKAGPGKVITYYYSLNIPQANSPITPSDKERLTIILQGNFCTNEDTISMKNDGIEMRYHYESLAGQPFAEVSSNDFHCASDK